MSTEIVSAETATKKVRGPYKKKNKAGNDTTSAGTELVPAGAAPLVGYDQRANHIQIGSSAKNLIDSLPNLKDEELTGLFRSTVDAERAMFVVRGATAHEIYKRALKEGQQFDKTKGGGVDSLINEVAKDVGIDGKTLYADFKVFDEFGGLLIEQLTTAPDTIMPREYYVLAMKSTTMAKELPSTILSYFQEQREVTGGYFTDHARRDIKLFNEGKTVEQVIELDAEQRKQKVVEKDTASTKKPATKTTSVEVIDSAQNIEWYRQIIAKYGSFNSFYERKCMDEFGPMEETKKK